MSRNIAKPFYITASIIDIQTISPKYRCFFGEDVELFITVLDEYKKPLDLSDVYVKVFYINSTDEFRQDDGITITDPLDGKLRVMVKKGYIQSGNSTVRVILFDNDQEIYLQPFQIQCLDVGIKDVGHIIVDDDLNARDEFVKVRGDISVIKNDLDETIKDVDNVKDSIIDINSSLDNKANESDVRKNNVSIIEQDLSDSLKASISGTAPINPVLLDKSIKPNKTSFFKEGANKIHTVVEGEYIKTTDGSVLVGDSWFRTDYLYVTEGDVYTLKRGRHIAYYKSDFTFINGASLTSGVTHTITIPSQCAYIRFSWYKTDLSSPFENMLNEGETSFGYEAYEIKIPSENVEKIPFDINDIDTMSLTIDKFKDVTMSKNLFNKLDCKINTTLSRTNGSESVATDFKASAYCNIKDIEGTKVFLSTCRVWCLYDENKTFISSSSDTISKDNIVIEIPSNASYLRFSVYKDKDINTIMLNEGDSAIQFEEFGVAKLKKEVIDFDFSNIGNGETPTISLPPTIYGVVGKEINVYFYNITNVDLKDYQIDVTCSLGKHLKDKWTATPTTIGTHTLTIDLYKNYNMVSTASCSVIIKDSNAGNGVVKNAIIIGDSTIAQDFLVNRLEDIFVEDVLKINLKGTLGTYSEKHNEGRAGWTMHDYRTDLAYQGVTNLFYNPTIKDFDFAYYMNNRVFSNETIHYVCLCLGINDTFAFKTDETLKTAITTVLSDFDYVINNILSYSDDIKIGVCVTIPPNVSQDAFGERYNCGTTQWRYKRNNSIWINELIKHFKTLNSRVTLIPDNSNINAETGFRDGVHPNKEIGDMQRADTFYYWFKSFES